MHQHSRDLVLHACAVCRLFTRVIVSPCALHVQSATQHHHVQSAIEKLTDFACPCLTDHISKLHHIFICTPNAKVKAKIPVSHTNACFVAWQTALQQLDAQGSVPYLRKLGNSGGSALQDLVALDVAMCVSDSLTTWCTIIVRFSDQHAAYQLICFL